MSGAAKASAIACAIGTRARPQKNNIAITVDMEPRMRWKRIAGRAGQGERRMRKIAPASVAPARVRQSKALYAPIARI
jgi:hypothetical protein